MRSVGRASVRAPVFRPIKEFTLEKKRTTVTNVVRTSVTILVLHAIRKSTLVRIFKNEKYVNGFSQVIQLLVLGESMLVINTMKY